MGCLVQDSYKAVYYKKTYTGNFAGPSGIGFLNNILQKEKYLVILAAGAVEGNAAVKRNATSLMVLDLWNL